MWTNIDLPIPKRRSIGTDVTSNPIPDQVIHTQIFEYNSIITPTADPRRVSGSHGTLFKNRPGEATAGEITTSLTQKLMPPILLDAWRGLRKRR
jgi:hypothetical protein